MFNFKNIAQQLKVNQNLIGDLLLFQFVNRPLAPISRESRASGHLGDILGRKMSSSHHVIKRTCSRECLITGQRQGGDPSRTI